MTINTETIRDAAEVLDTLTSTLAVDHPLRVEATSRAKSCVSGLYSAADALDAQAAEIAEARSQIEHLDRQNNALRDALGSIRQYGNDTLSGRADGGPDDRKWQREAVIEMRNRARAALSGEIQ